MAESGSMAAKPPQPHANLDGLGIFWITFALSWTFIVAGGMIFLWRRRDMPMLRIRGLPLSFLAITLLHLYWGAVQTGYVWFPLAAPEIEFWIMSVYLPCGIALFHASNSRFLYVAKTQKELFASDTASIISKPAKPKSFLRRFQSLNYTQKILIFVGAGMVFQVIQLEGGIPIPIADLKDSSYLHSLCSSFRKSSIPPSASQVLRLREPKTRRSLKCAEAGNGSINYFFRII